MKTSLLVAVFPVLLVTLLSSASVEGTWGWFTAAPELPALRRPTECGTGIIVGTVGKRGVPDNFTTVDLPSLNTSPTPIPVDLPVESRTLGPTPDFGTSAFGTSDFGIPLGSSLPNHPGAWLVRIGNTSAGVLVSRRHVVTLAECLSPFARWIGGFYDFGVHLLGEEIPVLKVEVQTGADLPNPLAVLTLADHNMTEAISVCVGDYKQGLTYSAVTWELSEGIPMKYPVLVYPHSACNSAAIEEHGRNVMLCASPGSPGPMVCGSPLLQDDSGRYLLIGLASVYVDDFVKYVQLSQARGWLGL